MTPQQAPMEWLRRLAQNRLLDIGAVLLALVSVMRIGAALPGRMQHNDFAHYYVSSRMWLQGKNPYTTPLASDFAGYGFVYQERIPVATNPPFLVWLFAPVAALPIRMAYWVWVGVQVAALGAILWLSWQEIGARLSPRQWRWLVAGVMVWDAVLWHFLFSQVQLVIAALVLAGFRLWRREQGAGACVMVTVAGLLKLFPLVLLPWFIGRGAKDWRVAGRRMLAVATVVVAAIGVTGWRNWMDFVVHGLPVVNDFAVKNVFTFSVPSWVLNLGYVVYDFSPPVAVRIIWHTVAIVAGLLLIAAAYGWCWRRGDDPEVEFGLLSVAMIAGSVTAWPHYFVCLIFPLAVAVARAVARPTLGRVVLLVSAGALMWSFDPFVGEFWRQHMVLKILGSAMPLYGLLILGGYFASEVRRRL